MLIRIHYKSFSLKDLRNLCKKKRLRNYSNFNKKDLVFFFNKYYSGLYINKVLCKKIRKNIYINNKDPIRLDYITYPCLYLQMKENKTVRYNIPHIYNYIAKSGIFKDPFTGTDFTEKHLNTLDSQLEIYNINKIPLLTLKTNTKYINFYKNESDKNMQIIGLERQIGLIITEIQDMIETFIDESILYFRLINDFLPSFSVLFRQLSVLDQAYAINSGNDYICNINNSKTDNCIINFIKKYIKDEINMI